MANGSAKVAGAQMNKQLSELLKSNLANFCRKAMISVLLNKPAPSSKTYFWDGIDFVSYCGGKTDVLEHPKFKQYLSVTLEREIIQSAIDFWSIDGNKKKINPNANILVSSFEITSGVTENDLGFKTSTSEVFSGYRKDTLKIKKVTENLKAVDFKSGTIFWTTHKN